MTATVFSSTDFEYFPAATSYEFEYEQAYFEALGQRDELANNPSHDRSSFSTTPTMQHPQPLSPFYPSGPSYLPSPPAPPLFASSSTQPQPYLPNQSPEPLFDSAQSALFSSFLTTMAVDQEFLFNPILPEGMPSPPAALPPGIGLTEFERHTRVVGESLGRSVSGLRLESSGSGSPRLDGRERRGRGKEVRRYHDEYEGEEELLRAVKKEEDEEREYEEVEGAFDEFPSTKGKTKRSPTASKGAGGGRGRGKKARLDDDDDFSDGQRDEDAEMNQEQEYRDEEEQLSPPYRSPPPKSRKSSLTASAKKGKRRTPTTTRSDSPIDDRAHSGTPEGKRPPLTEGQKRSNHILSEQKRRNAIRSGFKDLVDLLTAGETASSISISAAPLEPIAEELTAGGKKKKPKGTGRGRGRKGEVGAGASKSVILEKASMYIAWLKFGNQSLEEEVARVEALALN